MSSIFLLKILLTSCWISIVLLLMLSSCWSSRTSCPEFCNPIKDITNFLSITLPASCMKFCHLPAQDFFVLHWFSLPTYCWILSLVLEVTLSKLCQHPVQHTAGILSNIILSSCLILYSPTVRYYPLFQHFFLSFQRDRVPKLLSSGFIFKHFLVDPINMSILFPFF